MYYYEPRGFYIISPTDALFHTTLEKQWKACEIHKSFPLHYFFFFRRVNTGKVTEGNKVFKNKSSLDCPNFHSWIWTKLF